MRLAVVGLPLMLVTNEDVKVERTKPPDVVGGDEGGRIEDEGDVVVETGDERVREVERDEVGVAEERVTI